MAKFSGFNNDYKGPSTNQVIEKRLEYGYNELVEQKKETFFHKIICVLKEPMFLLLIITSLIYFFLGEPKDGMIMLISVLVMISIEVFQEWRTDKTLEALKELSSPKVRVIRDEKLIEIDSRELIVNDLMVVSEGDKIPADGIIIEMFDLGIDESILTGESDIVWKSLTPSNNRFRTDYCYSGTSVTQGSAIIKIMFIGPNTEYGKIGTAILNTKKDKTPLEKQVNKLIISFATVGIILSIVVMIATFLHTYNGLLTDRITASILAGITLAMALIPEEFPVILTVFLAMGVWRLAKKNSIIRKMPSIETLGSVSVLCVDKTGTLTQNKMTVQEIYNLIKRKDFLKYSVLACEKEPYDPMEKAILKYGFEEGINENIFDNNLLFEYSFSYQTKMMGHIWELKNKNVLVVKGAPESIMPLCHLTKEENLTINNKIEEMTKEGYRVIALAVNEDVTNIKNKLEENELTIIGLIALADPPREASYEAIKTCYKAGLRVIMITGDNPKTACSIARKIGIKNHDNYLIDEDIENMSDEELSIKVKTNNIFARVVPSHKMRIIKALKDNGEIVAMTGDGVNDAPALKYADIGIAMGERGTNVAKEASDMILLNDDFETIVDTIKDGRRIYDNIKKAIGYILVVHIPIALTALLTPILNLPLMLLPVHIVLFELIIDPTCSIIFERHPAESNVMSRKPRNKNESLVNKNLIMKSIIQGLMIFIGTFGSYVLLLKAGYDVDYARTFSLVVLFASNFFLVFINHSNIDPALRGLKLFKDKVVLGVCLVILSMLSIILYTSFGNSIAKTVSLDLYTLVLAISIAILITVWYEVVKIIKFIIVKKKLVV